MSTSKNEMPWQYESIEPMLKFFDQFSLPTYIVSLVTLVCLAMFISAFKGKPYPPRATGLDMQIQELEERKSSALWGLFSATGVIVSFILVWSDL